MRVKIKLDPIMTSIVAPWTSRLAIMRDYVIFRIRRRCIMAIPNPHRENTTTTNSILPARLTHCPCPFPLIFIIFRSPLPTRPSIHKPKDLPWPPPFHKKQPKGHKGDDYNREGGCGLG